MTIILDFGASKCYLNSEFYEVQEIGNTVIIKSKTENKQWEHVFKGKDSNSKEIRYYIKEEK